MSKYEHPNVVGCSNGGCILKEPSGMHTNATCSCISTHMSTKQVLDTKQTIHYLRKLLEERDKEIVELKKANDK